LRLGGVAVAVDLEGASRDDVCVAMALVKQR
jgi:hypothetical protein